MPVFAGGYTIVQPQTDIAVRVRLLEALLSLRFFAAADFAFLKMRYRAVKNFVEAERIT